MADPVITWSESDGGVAIDEILDLGQFTGVPEDPQMGDAITIFPRHNQDNVITNARVYIAQKTGSYGGDNTALSDWTNLCAMGHNNTGGFQFNMNAEEDFPEDDWLSFSEADGGIDIPVDQGIDLASAIILPTTTGCTAAGTIPSGNAAGVSFQVRFTTPGVWSDDSEEGIRTIGVYQFELRMRYTYTS